MDGKLTSSDLLADYNAARELYKRSTNSCAKPADIRHADECLATARAAIIARLDQRDELLAVMKELVAVLRKEAPGTPLNDRRFVDLGIAANRVITKAESTP